MNNKTEFQYWIRPHYYFETIEEHLRQFMPPAYPNGMKLIQAGWLLISEMFDPINEVPGEVEKATEWIKKSSYWTQIMDAEGKINNLGLKGKPSQLFKAVCLWVNLWSRAMEYYVQTMEGNRGRKDKRTA